MRDLRRGAQSFFLISLVIRVVSLEPHDLAITFEREDVRGDPIKEPAIVRDDHRAAGEVEQRLLEGAQRVDVEVVGGLVEEQPDAGAIALGDTVDLAYVDQSRDALDPDKTVWEEISDGYDQIKVGDREIASRAYVAGFNFKGSDQQRKVGVLSGGERNRVHLAKLLRRGGNVLLLDEPTNDLDVDTLRALEEALLSFAGCAVIISHDRWFLDRVATHVLAFEGDSQVVWFEGNFEAYEEHRRELLGAEADRPHRITYKKLVRA